MSTDMYSGTLLGAAGSPLTAAELRALTDRIGAVWGRLLSAEERRAIEQRHAALALRKTA